MKIVEFAVDDKSIQKYYVILASSLNCQHYKQQEVRLKRFLAKKTIILNILLIKVWVG